MTGENYCANNAGLHTPRSINLQCILHKGKKGYKNMHKSNHQKFARL